MSTYSSQAVKKLERSKKELLNLQDERANVVKVITKTGDETLVEALSENRNKCAGLEITIKQEDETIRTAKLPVDYLIEGLSIARELFLKGELAETKQLIEIYVNKVVVYSEDIQVYFNAIPSMSHLTNIDEFMEVFALKNTDCSKLLNANIDRTMLNQELRKPVKIMNSTG